MASDIGKQINTTKRVLDKELINKWDNIKLILKYKYVTGVKECNSLEAEKYKFDLWGLFRNVFRIEEHLIYPHIIVNDFNSWTDYNGNQILFKMLDNGVLSKYYMLFISSK